MRSEDDTGAGPAGDSEGFRRAIDAMPRRLREILVLRELEGCCYREISEITSLPTGAIMLRLALARRRLVVAVAAPPALSGRAALPWNREDQAKDPASAG
jgi:DNA-directed RNA polymerase specialized sigma24 family protein